MNLKEDKLLEIIRRHNKEVDALCISWEKLEEVHPTVVAERIDGAAVG